MLIYLLVVAGLISVAAMIAVRRGRANPRTTSHEYFDRLWLWPPGSHTRWEAEVDASAPGIHRRIGIHAEATHDTEAAPQPTEAEVGFALARIGDLDGLYDLARPAVEEGWNVWCSGPLPEDWRSVLSLEGFSVPKGGDRHEDWGVTYFCEPAGHYFCVEIRDGRSILASVDG